MKSYENTFVRDSSPTYSDEAASENDLSVTLPIGAVAAFNCNDTKPNCYFDEKLHCMFNNGVYTNRVRKSRNTFAFWMIIVILLILTVGNLILTLTIIGVLHFGKGIQGVELIPEVGVIKFYGSTDLDRVYTKTVGQIGGFLDIPITVTGDSVYVRVYKNGVLNDRILLDKEGIVIRGTNLFEIKDPNDGAPIFTTHRPQYNIPKGVDMLTAKTVSAARITSPIDRLMSLDSDGHIAIKGSEGISLDGAAVLLQAEHHIAINSSHGDIVFEADAGIFLDMDRVPIVISELGLRTGSVQFKICVCIPQGTLFRIAIPRIHNGPKISCAHFSGVDPCSLN